MQSVLCIIDFLLLQKTFTEHVNLTSLKQDLDF